MLTELVPEWIVQFQHRFLLGINVSCGSNCEKLRLSRTSPLVPPIADIRADIAF